MDTRQRRKQAKSTAPNIEHEEQEEEVLEEDEYVVERILDERKRGRRLQYLVRWEGYSAMHDSWVDADDMYCEKLIRQYQKQRKLVQDHADDEYYEVERILKIKVTKKDTMYFVRWKGYDSIYDSWVDAKDMDSERLIEEYKANELLSIAKELGITVSDRSDERSITLNGYYCLRGDPLSADTLHTCNDMVRNHFNKVMYTLHMQDKLCELQERGFVDFKSRKKGRYDFQVPGLNSIINHRPWEPLIYRILGRDCRLISSGCILSLPDSEVQLWHTDGDVAFNSILNIFIPLVDLTAENGPTEVIPTSHLPGRVDELEHFMKTSGTYSTTMPEIRAGECLIFDYVLYHRGLANKSTSPRPVLYFSYAKKGVTDSDNFSKKRYRKSLPDLLDLPAS